MLWRDLRSEMQFLVDPGLMARLLLAESCPVGGFQNMSLEASALHFLGYRVDKSCQVSRWDEVLTDDQIRCEWISIFSEILSDV